MIDPLIDLLDGAARTPLNIPRADLGRGAVGIARHIVRAASSVQAEFVARQVWALNALSQGGRVSYILLRDEELRHLRCWRSSETDQQTGTGKGAKPQHQERQ